MLERIKKPINENQWPEIIECKRGKWSRKDPLSKSGGTHIQMYIYYIFENLYQCYCKFNTRNYLILGDVRDGVGKIQKQIKLMHSQGCMITITKLKVHLHKYILKNMLGLKLNTVAFNCYKCEIH